MPKTAMHKNHFASRWENKIRMPRQPFDVKSIAKTQTVKQPPDQEFRPRVLGTHEAH